MADGDDDIDVTPSSAAAYSALLSTLVGGSKPKSAASADRKAAASKAAVAAAAKQQKPKPKPQATAPIVYDDDDTGGGRNPLDITDDEDEGDDEPIRDSKTDPNDDDDGDEGEGEGDDDVGANDPDYDGPMPDSNDDDAHADADADADAEGLSVEVNDDKTSDADAGEGEADGAPAPVGSEAADDSDDDKADIEAEDDTDATGFGVPNDDDAAAADDDAADDDTASGNRTKRVKRESNSALIVPSLGGATTQVATNDAFTRRFNTPKTDVPIVFAPSKTAGGKRTATAAVTTNAAAVAKLQPVSFPALKEHVFTTRAGGKLPGTSMPFSTPPPAPATAAAAAAAAPAADADGPATNSLSDYGAHPALVHQWRIVHNVASANGDTKQSADAGAGDAVAVGKRKRSSFAAAASSSSSKTAGSAVATSKPDLKDAFTASVFSWFNSYSDVWYAARDLGNCHQLRKLTCLHVLNHIFKTKHVIYRNNDKLKRYSDAEKRAKTVDLDALAAAQSSLSAKQKKKNRRKAASAAAVAAEAAKAAAAAAAAASAAAGTDSYDPADDPAMRDQGFSRPKVLILLPYRNSAYAYVRELLKLLPDAQKRTVMNKKRFQEEYGNPPGYEPLDVNKPADYRACMEGNNDDCFRFGITFSNKRVQLFSPLSKSDILICSPLSLRMVTGSDADAPKNRDFDFLSSIEVVVVDQAEVLAMQNWEHVQVVWSCLNKMPLKPGDTDFSRLRTWCLNGESAQYRQTICLSAYSTAELSALLTRQCSNNSGRIVVRPSYSGVLSTAVHTNTSVRHVFQRLSLAAGLSDVAQLRFTYFTTELLPRMKLAHDAHVLIVIPSYFDFVRVRNYCRDRHVNYVCASEYTKPGELSRSRSNFYHGRKQFMLITERFHFFRRYRIRGVRAVVFYSLPENPLFYAEFVNMLSDAATVASASASGSDAASTGSCVALFSKFDALQLERIIGSVRAQKLLTADKHTHMFT